MPIISMFYGIKIYIYMEKDGKHNIPHVHAYSGEDSLVVDFEGNIIEGQLERKKEEELLNLRTAQTASGGDPLCGSGYPRRKLGSEEQ